MSFDSLDSLRQFVIETLSTPDQLAIGEFQMTERVMQRGGKPCGIYFCLHGPRSVQLNAVWDALRNVVVFYGANGERFQNTKLRHAPSLEAVG